MIKRVSEVGCGPCYFSNSYGRNYFCSIYYLEVDGYCPCSDCLVKAVCTRRCKQLRDFLKKYGGSIVSFPILKSESFSNRR